MSKVTNGTRITETDYLGGYQYQNNKLMYFPTSEGYVNITHCTGCVVQPNAPLLTSYVYNYTDHLGNVRVSYTYDASTNALKTIEENHYYPFGLKHTNYDTSMWRIAYEETAPTKKKIQQATYWNGKYNYKYQGQERQDELDLNWDSFKWRNYDYAIGRFMSIDPLAETSRR